MSEDTIRISAEEKVNKTIELDGQIDVLEKILFGEKSGNNSVRDRDDMLERLAIVKRKREEIQPTSIEELKMMNEIRTHQESINM